MITEEQYHAKLAEIEALVAGPDITPGSPQEVWLTALVDDVELYERRHFPDLFDTEPVTGSVWSDFERVRRAL